MHPYYNITHLNKAKGLNNRYPYYIVTETIDITQDNKIIKIDYQALTKAEVDQFREELNE